MTNLGLRVNIRDDLVVFYDNILLLDALLTLYGIDILYPFIYTILHHMRMW